MAMVDEQPSFGEAEAQRLLDAGWQQGAVFRPPQDLAGVPTDFDGTTEWLVVCTQSCTVVSPNLTGDPHVELVVAKPVAKLIPRSAEARGRNVRLFHLPVTGIPGAQALGCDINRRFDVRRDLFLLFTPEPGLVVTDSTTRSLAGWLSRYYSRIALPNELVVRAKLKNGLFEIIKKALEMKDADGIPLSDSIDGIYVSWNPNTEAAAEETYTMNIGFMCEDADAEDCLYELLDDNLEPFTAPTGKDGIVLEWAAWQKASTFVSQLDGFVRLTEWDYFSHLGDVADAVDKLTPT